MERDNDVSKNYACFDLDALWPSHDTGLYSSRRRDNARRSTIRVVNASDRRRHNRDHCTMDRVPHIEQIRPMGLDSCYYMEFVSDLGCTISVRDSHNKSVAGIFYDSASGVVDVFRRQRHASGNNNSCMSTGYKKGPAGLIFNITNYRICYIIILIPSS